MTADREDRRETRVTDPFVAAGGVHGPILPRGARRRALRALRLETPPRKHHDVSL